MIANKVITKKFFNDGILKMQSSFYMLNKSY